jgi:hypothetical protein
MRAIKSVSPCLSRRIGFPYYASNRWVWRVDGKDKKSNADERSDAWFRFLSSIVDYRAADRDDENDVNSDCEGKQNR